MCDGWHFNLELKAANNDIVIVDVHLRGTRNNNGNYGNDLVVSSDSVSGTTFKTDAPYTANTWHQVSYTRLTALLILMYVYAYADRPSWLATDAR